MRGSVKKVRDGVYRLRWDSGINPNTGRRRQNTKTVHGSRREAERVLALHLGNPSADPQHHTLLELVDAWLDITAHDLSPKTIDDRRRTWRLHIAPTLAHHQLHHITAHQLDSLYSHLRRQNKTQTAIKVHALLSGAFGQAVKWGWLDANPTRRATPPRQPRVKVSVPDVADIAKVLDVADRRWPHMGVLFRLDAATGMRRGELCALRWRDVDLDAATITVARSLVVVDGPGDLSGGRSRGRMVEKGTKTGSERKFAVGAQTLAMLRGYRKAMSEMLLAVGVRLGGDHYLFPFDLEHSRPVHPSVVSHRWRASCVEAGVAGLRLHDLRHSSASHLIAGGTDLRTVMERHGWTSLATAQRYIHAVPARDREAAETLDRLLGGER